MLIIFRDSLFHTTHLSYCMFSTEHQSCLHTWISHLFFFLTKTVSGLCTCVFLSLFFVYHTPYCSSEYSLCSQVCLCLSAAVNVCRRADCLRLSLTCLLPPCEPALCCFMAFSAHSVAGCQFISIFTSLAPNTNSVHFTWSCVMCILLCSRHW